MSEKEKQLNVNENPQEIGVVEERRVFHIDVGSMPSHLATEFVEGIKNEVSDRTDVKKDAKSFREQFNEKYLTYDGFIKEPESKTNISSVWVKNMKTKPDKEMLNLVNKLRGIEEKSHCGSIKALDAIANMLDSSAKWLNRRADGVRHFSWKISGPCAINFSKIKKSNILNGIKVSSFKKNEG